VIERLSAAQDSIAAFMNDHPDETAQIVADALDLDTEAVEEMSQYYDFSLDISDTDIEGFQKTADFMLEAGMIDEALDVNTLFFE
jgi:sulfonate transport system substrate-binding protein